MLLKKKSAPPTKSKGIVIGASVAPTALISVKEEEPALRSDVITLPPVSVHMDGLRKEEHLALTLEASIDTDLEERAVHVASFIYNRALRNLLVSLSPFYYLFFFSL